MHSSSTSVEIYDFALAHQVNVNKIIIFFTTILCSLKTSMKALIGFGRCYIPSADGLICSEPKSVCTILMRQLRANSWKYTCLRMGGLFTPCHSDMQGTEAVNVLSCGNEDYSQNSATFTASNPSRQKQLLMGGPNRVPMSNCSEKEDSFLHTNVSQVE